MSATKRTSVRKKATVLKPVAKTGNQRVRKTTKKTAKKITKKVAKKTTKKTVRKTTKKTARRTAKRAMPQTVKDARYGGHRNTLPRNPKAPGRFLGKSFTLSLLGLGAIPFNTDMIAISLARVGGVSIMVAGLLLSWNIFNQLAVLPDTIQQATVYHTQVTPVTVSITQEQPLRGEVPVVISATAATDIVLLLTHGTSTTVLGAAKQQAEQTWQYVFDTTKTTDGTYQLDVLITNNAGYYRIPYDGQITIANHLSAETTSAQPQASSTNPHMAASSSVPATTPEPATTTSNVVPNMTASTSMPVLTAPRIHMLAPQPDGTALVVGEGTPNQLVELLFLRDNQRVTTTVQPNGWWLLRINTPTRADTYELYAQASPELLSQPLDFSVIEGSLRSASAYTEQATAVTAGNPQREMFLWYLLVAITTISIGAVLLLLGHYLHFTRRKPGDEIPELDRSA